MEKVKKTACERQCVLHWEQLKECSQKWRRAHVVSMQRYSRCTPTKHIELRVDVVMTTRVLLRTSNKKTPFVAQP